MELIRRPTSQPAPARVGRNAGAPSAAPARRRRRTSARPLIPAGTTIVLLGCWELLARSGTLAAEVPPVTDVLGWLVEQLGESSFWIALRQTLWHWCAGLGIGGAAGVVLGVTIGTVPVVQRLLNVPLEFLRPIPAIVYLPLLILVMGSQSRTAIVLAALGAFWPMLLQSIYGVRAIDPQAVETGKVFGLTSAQILRTIMLPSVLPYLATGVRISASLALIVSISTELVGGVPGLGAELASAAQNGIYRGMYGLLLVTGVLGLVLNAALERTERRLLRWHVSHRPAA